jgi:Cu/Ag efflux protein CusF
MTKRFWLSATAIAALWLAPSVALAQKPVGAAAVTTATFTIEAINHDARIVSLKDKAGNYADIVCGPEVQRFDALKVGDTVTFSYSESVVSAIHKPAPGAPAKAPVSGGLTRTPGAAPGGMISQQMTAIVTIAAIDAKTPSVTITNDQGHHMSFKVADAKNLEGYKAGDKVEITYTQALAVSVASPGK